MTFSPPSHRRIILTLATLLLAGEAVPTLIAHHFPEAINPTAYAAEPEIGVSLDWQKVTMEEKIQNQLLRAIAPIAPENKAVVTVAITLKPQPKPKPTDKPEPKKDKNNGETKNNDVILGKLDLNAPLLPLAEQKPPEPLPNETPTRIEPPSLFENIAKLEVNILLDSSIAPAKKEIVTRIAQSSLPSLVNVKPEIKVDLVELIQKPLPSPAPSPEPWDMKRWAMEFKLPLGLILSIFMGSSILALLLLNIFGGYRKLEARKIALLEAQNARAEAAATQPQNGAEAVTHDEAPTENQESSGAGLDSEEGVQTGFDKLQAMLKDSPERVAALVKQWIRGAGEGSREALAVLPQVLLTEELFIIFNYLGPDDRKEWKRAIAMPVDQTAYQMASTFVSSQIFESLLIPVPEIEEGLRKNLEDLKLSEVVELAVRDPNHGAFLASILPTSQVVRMFTLIPADKANQITLNTLKLSNEELRKGSETLKKSISELRKDKKKSTIPFLDRAVELLREVEPQKEGAIYNALAEAKEYEMLESAARSTLPSELFSQLPEKLLKYCLERLPLKARAELIASRPVENRESLVNACGKAGTKAREMLDIEIQQVDSDEVRKKRLEKNRDLLWREFIQNSRANLVTYAARDDEAAEQLTTLVNDWLSKLTQGKLGGSNDSARAA